MTLSVLRPDWPAPAWVQALSTTRAGGVSKGPHATLNLGDACGDKTFCVAENRARLERFSGAEFFWLRQHHGTDCVEAGRSLREADASWTRRNSIACAILTADCLPLLLCHKDRPLVAAVHAGWRGLAAGVIERTLATLDCQPHKLLAWLGPAIGPEQFEVGEDVRDAFVSEQAADQRFFQPGLPGKWVADLAALARARLARAGVDAVFGGHWCTVSDPRQFFSYRRDGITGRLATGIWLACE